MSTTLTTPTTISLNVTKDLEPGSDLRTFFNGQEAAIFKVGSEVIEFAGQPIRSAISTSTKLTLDGDHSWKLPQGISFSLKGSANCTLAISDTSTKFSIQKKIDSSDTTNLVEGPTNGLLYINIDLDFDISGNLSGSGTVGGIGIGGKLSSAETATFSYCHPVSAALETVAAIKDAFSSLFFPFKPDCALHMPVGSIGKVSFTGSFNTEFDVSYGFGNYKFSAQSLRLAGSAVQLGPEKLQPPDITIDTGAKGSISYKHSDNFTVLVSKSDASTAEVTLLRSADSEVGESVGINVGISSTAANITLNTQKLAQTISDQVNAVPPTLANTLASSASTVQDSLVSKANNFLSAHKGDVGLMLSLSQHPGRMVLFDFKVDLAAAAGTLAHGSWSAMVNGDLGAALRIGGFKLLEDSGVADSLRRSCIIQLHFFNFQLGAGHDFFKNSVTKIGPDGSIRFFFDAGEEAKFTVGHETTTETIHFVATATEENWGSDPKDVEVDFRIDLSETKNPGDANRIDSTVGAIPADPAAQSAQHKMLDYVANNKDKTLTLIGIFKPSAYRKLSCSPYTKDDKGNLHPPALPQEQDRDNWSAFHAQVESLMHDVSDLVMPLTYTNWMDWNVYINYQIGDQPDDNHVPDRRGHGLDLEAARRLFGQDKGTRYYPFLEASTRFLNLCDDLKSLANSRADTPEQWKELLGTLENWIKSDTDPDWSKAAFGALLSLCSQGGAPQVAAEFQHAKDNSSFTCTLILS